MHSAHENFALWNVTLRLYRQKEKIIIKWKTVSHTILEIFLVNTQEELFYSSPLPSYRFSVTLKKS